MKFVCNKETLIKEINAAQKIITQKNQITIISNILLECENDLLTIKATDTKLRFETSIPVIMQEAGSIALFADRFAQILKALPNGDLVIETKDNLEQVHISIAKNSRIEYTLRYQNPQNFPWSEDPNKEEFFDLPKKDLLQMINTTIFAVSNDEVRLALNGVFMEKNEDKFIMVATDGKRLSYINQHFDSDIGHFENVIIPPKFLNLIKELSFSKDGEISLAIKDHHIYARFEGMKISSSLIDSKFPDYRRAIPEQQAYTCIVNRNEFTEAIKRIQIMADSKTKRIYCTVQPNQIELHVEELKMGHAREIVDCTYDGESMPFAFNYEHLLSPLRTIESDEVHLAFTHTDKPITLASSPEENYFHIIMSMAIDTGSHG